MTLTFFRSPAEFRNWLARRHATATELWVGFYKRDSSKPSITWPESVDEALCVGWIDGIRKRVDEVSYKIRFAPRRRGSIWSAINIRRVRQLDQDGRMQPAGLEAFEARRENKSGIYSYEQRRAQLEEPYRSLLQQNKPAWSFFTTQSPSYCKTAGWWIISAKQEATRLRRLSKLIAASARGERVV